MTSTVTRLLWMGSGTALRLGAGMATFVVMARLLGPQHFGVVMLWLSVATLIALLGNYGFTPYLLRELGARPQATAGLLSQVLTAKLVLVLALLLPALLAMPWLSPAQRWLLLAMLLAQLADGLAEVFNVGLRATGRFALEARLTGGVALAQLLLVAVGVWLWPTPACAAGAYLATRLGALLASGVLLRRQVAGVWPASLAQGLTALRAARAYAADTVLQSLLGQVDSLVLNHYVGPAAVGVYQAGLRLFNGGAQAAPILANVLLPQASAAFAHTEGGRFGGEAARLQWSFMAVGAGFGLVLALAAQPLTALLFGPQFSALAAVLPWLGLLFHVRFFAASWGVVLTAAGAQRFRAQANVAMWALTAALVPALVPTWGPTGWVMALVAGHVLLAVAYVARGWSLPGAGWRQPALAVAVALCFAPLLGLEPLR